MAGLHWADYLIFVGFLLLSIGVGLYHALSGGKQRTTSEFIMGNRKLSLVPTVLSLFVSYASAIMILGRPAELFTRGSQAWLMESLGFALAVLFAERFIIGWIYPLKLTSVYEYFSLRFASKAVRMYGAFLGICCGLLYMGVAMLAPAVALETATGFSKEASIPIMAAVATIYTAMGGMKAVIWTDVFQFVVMLAGMLGLLIKGAIDVNGFDNAIRITKENGRLTWINWSADPSERHTFWGYVIGWTINWGYMYGLHQASVQRYCGITSLKKARVVLLLNIPILILTTAIAYLTGLFVFAYYSEIVGCDPLASGEIKHANQILPQYVKDSFANVTGFNGLFLATLYSGALSSVSSSLSGVATNTWKDILSETNRFKAISDEGATIVNKILVVFYGCVGAGLAFLSASVPGPVTQVAVGLIGASSGPLFGMFLLGGLFQIAEWKGTLCGGIASLALNIWINGGSIATKGRLHPPLPHTSTHGCVPPVNVTSAGALSPATISGLDRLYTLSYLWYSPLGVVVTLVVGLTMSAAVRWRGKKHDATADEAETHAPRQSFMSLRAACYPCIKEAVSQETAGQNGQRNGQASRVEGNDPERKLMEDHV